MKITLVTDRHGTLVGTIRGHSMSERKGNMEAGVMVSAGHKAHHVDVDDSFGNITDAAELHEKLAKHLPKNP